MAFPEDLASARGGPDIWKLLDKAGFKGEHPMRQFYAHLDKKGIDRSLKTGSKAMKELETLSKLKYTPLPGELLKLEEEMGISKPGEPYKQQRLDLSKKLSDVQKWAHDKFGKKTTMPKLAGILKKLGDIPEIAKKGTKYLSKLGFRMIAPLTGIGYATDILNLTDVMDFKDAKIEPSAKVQPQTERFRGGGMADINTMTAPLGYYRGGPPVAPESSEGFDPIHTGYAEALANLQNKEYARKWNLTKPRQPGLDEQLMQDYVPPRPRWDKARELGKKGLEGIKGLGSKSIDILRQLLGSKAAEAGTYIPDSVLEEMTIEELVKEIQLFDIGHFGSPVGSDDISHLRELTDALEKHMGKYK